MLTTPQIHVHTLRSTTWPSNPTTLLWSKNSQVLQSSFNLLSPGSALTHCTAAAENDCVFSLQSKKEPAIRWELLPCPVTPNRTHPRHPLLCGSVPTTKVNPLSCAVRPPPPFTSSATAINHVLSLTNVHRVLRAESLSQPFTFPSLSCSYTPLLWLHMPGDFPPSLSPLLKATLLERGLFLAFGLHVLILRYVCLSDLGRADMTLSMPHPQLSFSHLPNTIMASNIMVIQLFTVNTIT